jgi:hypothetical protein
MLHRKIIAVCSQIHTKHINTLCGQNVELLNVKRVGTHSNHLSCVQTCATSIPAYFCFSSLFLQLGRSIQVLFVCVHILLLQTGWIFHFR